ncbi:hypothetical protein GW796_10850 [archaeon]|nr:hypothetical protein [archaeon]
MKNYIKVPFSEKEDAKQLGAKWDKELKSWYVPDEADASKFKKWSSFDPSTIVQSDPNATRIHLNVPFADKDEVKAAGGRWDGDKKQWYYMSDKDGSGFSKWTGEQSPAKSPKLFQKPKALSNDDTLSDEMDDILKLGED